MKKYECLYIVNINYDSEGTSAVAARVEGVLKNVGAELVNSQSWGKRKLAYAINKERYGDYILLHFQGENPNIAELHRELEIEGGVLHYMTIRLDEFPDFDSLSVPQAYETDRKRSSGPAARRNRQYDEVVPAPAPAVVEADVIPPVEDVIVSEDVEDIVTEVADEAVEETAAPEESETSQEENEKPAEEAEEDPEKPADAE